VPSDFPPGGQAKQRILLENLLKFWRTSADELSIAVLQNTIYLIEMIKIISYLCRQPKTNLMGVGILSVILIGYATHHAGLEISASIFYLLPVALVSWCAGRREGGFIASASSVAWYVADWYAGREYSHPLIHYWNMIVMFGFFFVVGFTLSGFKMALEKEKGLARVDSLTGVFNVRYFTELANKEIERCRRYGHPLTLIYLDCDNFKEINDHLSHQAGDRLLRSLGLALQHNTRSTDIIVRMGGDEFAILMPETGDQIAPQALKRLQTRLQEALQQSGWSITLSMGAAIFLDPPESVDLLIKSADCLMFLAKNNGKNRIQYQVFDEEKYDLTSSLNHSFSLASEPLPSESALPVAPDGLLPGSPLKTTISPPA